KVYGNFTRFCEVRIAPSSRDEPERLAEFLLRAANELQGAVIFPTCDLDIVFLDRFRSALEPCYRLSIPPRHCIQQVINKNALVGAGWRDEGEGVGEFLLRGANELQGAVIFPTCDLDIVFLDRFRSALEPCYRLSIPPRHCIQQVINKHALVSAARQAGVAVP